MGKVYLGDEYVGDMYTHNVVDITETVVDVLKKPTSRYMVDENGVAKMIEGDVIGAFDDITSIGSDGLYSAFNGCTGLTGSMSFPKLTSIGSSGLRNIFYNCTSITELHFRADAQATIEAQSGYSSRFGATNATIYFDL